MNIRQQKKLDALLKTHGRVEVVNCGSFECTGHEQRIYSVDDVCAIVGKMMPSERKAGCTSNCGGCKRGCGRHRG